MPDHEWCGGECITDKSTHKCCNAGTDAEVKAPIDRKCCPDDNSGYANNEGCCRADRHVRYITYGTAQPYYMPDGYCVNGEWDYSCQDAGTYYEQETCPYPFVGTCRDYPNACYGVKGRTI